MQGNIIVKQIPMNTGQKLFKSAVYGQLPIITQLISGFVIMPLMIKYFGDRYFGIWVLAGTLLGFFGLLDLGFSRAIVRFVSRALGHDNSTESDGWISLGLVLLVAISIIGVLILIPSLWLLGFFVTEDLSLIRIVFFIVGFSFLITLPSNCFIGILQAHVRSDILNKIIIVVNLLRILLFLTALYFEADFIIFITILALTNILQGILVTVFALKILGKFNFQRKWLNKKNTRVFIEYSSFSFISQLADLLRFEAYPLIISTFLGLAAITTFQIAHRIRLMLGQVHNKILANFTAVFSKIEGKFGFGNELKKTYFFAYKLSIFFVFFSIGITMIISPHFIDRWMGTEYSESYLLLIIALIGSLAAGIQIPVVCFLFGTSKHRFYAFSNIIESILIVLSSVFLIKRFGLIGMVTGASISTFIVKTFIQPIWVMRALKISALQFYVNLTLKNLLIVFIFLIPSYYIGKSFLEANYLKIGIFGIISSILFIPYIWKFGFTRAERNLLVESLRLNNYWIIKKAKKIL